MSSLLLGTENVGTSWGPEEARRRVGEEVEGTTKSYEAATGDPPLTFPSLNHLHFYPAAAPHPTEGEQRLELCVQPGPQHPPQLPAVLPP